jgi:hypothetical protein
MTTPDTALDAEATSLQVAYSLKQEAITFLPTPVKKRQQWVVGQFECNAILKGCELIAVGERCDTTEHVQI